MAVDVPNRPLRPCTTPGCSGRIESGRCDECRSRRRSGYETERGSPAQRGYGAVWRARRLDYLARHPFCALCPRAATVPDHWPLSRRELTAAGVSDPDADEYLRPLCAPCHAVETARNQPGGWNRSARVTRA